MAPKATPPIPMTSSATTTTASNRWPAADFILAPTVHRPSRDGGRPPDPVRPRVRPNRRVVQFLSAFSASLGILFAEHPCLDHAGGCEPAGMGTDDLAGAAVRPAARLARSVSPRTDAEADLDHAPAGVRRRGPAIDGGAGRRSGRTRLSAAGGRLRPGGRGLLRPFHPGQTPSQP